MDLEKLTQGERELLVRTLKKELEKVELELNDSERHRSALLALLEKINLAVVNYDIANHQDILKSYNLSWREVCMKAMSDFDDFIQTKDIYRYLITSYNEFGKEKFRSKIISNISWTLSQLTESYEIVRIDRVNRKGHLWGLPTWFDENGEPQTKYRFKLAVNKIPNFKYKPVRKVVRISSKATSDLYYGSEFIGDKDPDNSCYRSSNGENEILKALDILNDCNTRKSVITFNGIPFREDPK